MKILRIIIQIDTKHAFIYTTSTAFSELKVDVY